MLRLLRGEDPDLLSRELKVTPSTLSGWRTAFLSAGQAGLKTRRSDGREEEVRSLKAMVGLSEIPCVEESESQSGKEDRR